MIFEFMYNNTWYKYADGYIYSQNGYEPGIPVVRELKQILDNFSLPDKQNIMCALVYGYTCGIQAGAAVKAREVRRVLGIEERCDI